jgi:hypothetical protein
MYKIIIIIIVIIILFACINLDNFSEQNENIICYFHICQKDGWQKSFDLSMDMIKKSGLYEYTNEFRIGIVNDNSILVDDIRFNDPKVKIIFVKSSSEYERPTLLHMKAFSYKDPKGTLYYYLHTKGIRHFNTSGENIIIDWINQMLYYNIEKWKDVITILKTYETYGCNYHYKHYSGNFWWSTAEHVKKISDTIGNNYTDPEDWILTNKDNMYCVHNCSENYKAMYPDGFY